METASIQKNEVAVTHSNRNGIGEFLTVECPNGWDDVKKLTKKVLKYQGKRFLFTGWCSDKNQAFFKCGQSWAVIE